MSKDISIRSRKWNDLVFEGKNKGYGAYHLRMTSSRRLVAGFLACITTVIVVSFLPVLIDTVGHDQQTDQLSESTVLADLGNEPEEQVQDLIREEKAPPEPPLKSTVQFTAPVIVDANEIKKDEEIKPQEELAESKVQISVATVEGTDDKNGADIADLEQQKAAAEAAENKIFEIVEQSPQFPGGDQALRKYLEENLKYPVIAQENGIEGRVYVTFVIDKNGDISDIQVRRSPDASLGKEAIRVVQSMPKWIPGKQNGRNVRVYFTLPVNFRLK